MRYKEVVKKISVPAENKIKQKQYIENGRLPVIDQGSKLIGGYSDDEEKIVKCNLPVIVFGDHTKCVKYVNFPFCAGADGIKVLKPKDDCSEKYLYYLTKYVVLKIKDHGYARHYQYVEKEEVYIPSLNEQARIVSRIEEVFSELDKGVETLQIIKEQLAVYRQAVLKMVFASMNERKPIKEVSSLVTSGSRGWAKYYSEEGVRFIRITDLNRDKIKLKNNAIQHVLLPEEAEGKRSRLQGNDVLISITADLGSIALVPEDIEEAYINQHIALVRFLNCHQGEFMAWYLKSDYGQKKLLCNKRGGGKLGLGLDDIRNTSVPIVSDEVADKVVSEIESRMSVCDSIEQTVNVALSQAEAMRQSILKKAFEGGLN